MALKSRPLNACWARVCGVTCIRDIMTPTVFREKGYRFFFFSREENRMHVHVISGDGEAKYWLEPKIELAEITVILTGNLMILSL
jgi:hypothetical protein